MAAETRAMKSRKASRQALIVLGMHRTGTSALSGVLVKLGVHAPKSLMRPTPDNPRGYWESTALMTFHNRILASAGTRWNDWDNFNPEWIESPASAEFLTDLSSLLEDEYGDACLILLKDPRMCRMFPLWSTALKALDITPKVIIPLRSPAEVARSLEVRDQLPANEARLLWLRHLLDAEYNSRNIARAFVRYSDLLDDWRTEMDRVSEFLDVKWPRKSAASQAEIDDFLAPELRHHAVIDHSLPENSSLDRWVADTYRAMDSFLADPHQKESQEALNAIRLEFNRTSDIYAPVFHQQRHQFERKIQGLEEETQQLAARLEDLQTRHQALQEESRLNFQLYTAEQKALAKLSKEHQGREDTFVAMTSKFEVMQAEAASNAARARAAHESARLCGEALEERFVETAKLTKAVFDLEEQCAAERAIVSERNSTIGELEGENLTLTKNVFELHEQLGSARAEVGEKSSRIVVLEHENVTLTKNVVELQEQLAAERATIRAERARLQARIEDGGRMVSERDNSIGTLRAMMDESTSRIRSLELEIDAQSKVIVDYLAALETTRSSPCHKLAEVVRGTSRSGRKVLSTDDAKPDDEVLRNSHLFDGDWYLERYPDVRSKGVDPIQHYLTHGANEGRDPCAAFSTAEYVARNPDVAASGANPLVHYLKQGRREGRLMSASPAALEKP